MQNTQLSLTLSFDSLVNKYHKNFFNVFGTNKQQKKIMSTFMLMNREKIDYEKEISKKNIQIDNLKKALELIMIKNNPSKEIMDLLNENNLLKKIGDEFGGKFKLDETNIKYEFKKNVNMFDGLKSSSTEKKDENIKKNDTIEENEVKNKEIEFYQNNNQDTTQETNLDNEQKIIDTNLNNNENYNQEKNYNNKENNTQDINLNNNDNNNNENINQDTNLNNNENNNETINQNIIIEDEEKLD